MPTFIDPPLLPALPSISSIPGVIDLPGLCDLLALGSADRWQRRNAARRMSVQSASARYGLRRALWHDPDATARAAAATRLGRCPDDSAAEVSAWLCDSTDDASALVREASLRSLARLSRRLGRTLEAARETCLRLVREDAVWWVRRAAVLALTALDGVGALPVLREVLADPFWRVRHAAVQALLAMGDAQPALRAQILAMSPPLPALAQSGLWYLRARWQPGVEVHAFASPPLANGELANADPAVVTARVRRRLASELEPAALVPFLAEAHQPLRELAVERLRQRPELPALRQALVWLETPTQPHAAEAVTALLDSLGEPARILSLEILRSESPPLGALRWACRQTILTLDGEVRSALLTHAADPRAQVRAAAIEALAALEPLPAAELRAALSDPALAVRSAAALALAGAGDPSLRKAPFSQPPGRYHPLVRAALVETARRQRMLGWLLAAARDPHPLAKAQALDALVRLGEHAQLGELAELHASPDPEVRLAVLRCGSPELWLRMLGEDPDPLVRRRALALLSGRRRHLPKAVRAAAAALASVQVDARLRLRSCLLLDVSEPGELRTLLTLLRDPELAVRSAAAAQLEAVEHADALAPRLLALLADRASRFLSDEQRAAAYAALLSLLGAEALPIVERALAAGAEPEPELEPEVVRAQLLAMRQLLPGASSASLLAPLPAAELRADERSPRRRPVPPLRRPLGQTGIAVSPLGLSGAYDPPATAIRAALRAGVNMFFWEPRYLGLTRFLRHRFQVSGRRAETVVVAGSFEGDRVGIERDVAQALRRLGTDYIDVFLLLWVRSPERLCAEARECLQELKRQGRIRAFGFSTHHRELAAQAIAGPGDAPPASAPEWDVLMLRHSAAHPGAEDRLLPLCARRGVGVITFSALSYGRLLRPVALGDEPSRLPTAGECYRYSLGQPGVAACWSAPRSARELRENLELLPALARPLTAETIAGLRAHGRKVREEDHRWSALLRKGHEGAPEALAMLAQEDLRIEKDARPVLADVGDASRLSWRGRSEKI